MAMKVSLATALLVVSGGAVANDPSFDWDWLLSSSMTHKQASPLLGRVADEDVQGVDSLLDVQINWSNVSGAFALRGNQIASSDSSQHFELDFIVPELYWQGTVDSDNPSIELTLGKVRLDWGVGYGYRPLDIFKPYRRHPLGVQVEEGAGTGMLSYFDAWGEWSLVYTDSSWTQVEGSALDEINEQQGFGLRRYVLNGDSEWQALAYYDDVRLGTIGGSWVTVLNASWEVHASALYQRYYYGFDSLNAGLNTPYGKQVEMSANRDGLQGLIGFNWANSIGHNIILEYWYDSRSWGRDEWSQAFDSIAALDANGYLGASPYANGLNHTNLVQHNILFHWSHSKLWSDDIEPTFDLLFSPEDRGVIATQWINYHAFDSGNASVDIELAARIFMGDDASLYANLQDKHMILLNLKGKF